MSSYLWDTTLVGFVRFHLRAGRVWLAWTIVGLRTIALLFNFLVGQNLNYREITALRHVQFLGEPVSVGVGILNPFMVIGQLSLLFLVIFTVDAGISVWKRGDRYQAVLIGGSIIIFALASVAQSVLVFWHIVGWPLTASFYFLGIVAAMAYDKSRDTLRVAQLADDLRERTEQMTLASETAKLGYWSRELARNEIWAGETWRRLFGFTKSERIDFDLYLARLHSEDRDIFQQTVAKAIGDGGTYSMEYRVVLPNGQMRWIASHGRVELNGGGKPVRVRGVSADITDRKQAEQELLQKRNELAHLSRVTSVSELSGSLAHELNQPLGIILSNAQAAQELLQQHPPIVDEVGEILTDIVAADHRAAEIIQRLRSLLKRGEMSRHSLSLNELIDEVLRLVNFDLIGRGITVVRNLAPDLPSVIGDRVQLQQLTLNLILNAADAMEGNAPGMRRLQVTTARQESTVIASVRDEGVGLPTDIESLFQPFFTTKPQGLGLGLGICRTIIQAHQGRLWAEPHPERGAIFYFELPVADAQDQT